MFQIQYVSAPAGSGKTYELARWATERVAAHEKIVIAQPTKKLMQETAKAIVGLDPNTTPTLFYSRSKRDNVTARIQAHFEGAAPHHGEVIIVSHEALSRLPDSHKKFWHLFVDEMPSVFSASSLNIPKTHHLVTTSTRIAAELVSGIGVIEKASPLLETIATSDDDGYRPFQQFARAVLDPNILVLADTDQFNDLIGNSKTTGKFYTYHIERSNFVQGFGSVTMMSANFEDCELYHFWDRFENIQWAKHPIQHRIEAGARFQGGVHKNGSRLSVRYLFDEDVGLEYLRGTNGTECPLDLICELVEADYAGSSYLWHVNKDFQMATPLDHAGLLPMVSHGINQPHFVATHNVAIISAFNYGSPACRFLKKLGFDDRQFRTMLNYQKDYQTMMRCSLRDPAATRPVDLLVLSRGSAEYIAGKFPGCNVAKVEHEIAPPKRSGGQKKAEPKTRAEIQKAYRARLKAAA
ncbi:hypothetical protein [Sphingobium yanoikuyae]|uniref:DEAD/DEAH box helicase family protein n=1 Tax=Sphingobium yanoikuyae TaxID=13690 RepID=UPI0028AC4002|nr:hypothetical protein [Sphingobium yanoikuyae]